MREVLKKNGEYCMKAILDAMCADCYGWRLGCDFCLIFRKEQTYLMSIM